MSQKTEGLRLLSGNSRSLHRTLLYGSVLLTIFLSGIYLFPLKTIEIINLKVTDIILTSAKAPEPKLDIISVAIDEASIKEIWPMALAALSFSPTSRQDCDRGSEKHRHRYHLPRTRQDVSRTLAKNSSR